MMQIPLIDVAVDPLPTPPLPKAVIYIVAAFNLRDKYWKVHRDSHHDEHKTEAEAIAHANKIPGTWAHKRILKVVLE